MDCKHMDLIESTVRHSLGRLRRLGLNTLTEDDLLSEFQWAYLRVLDKWPGEGSFEAYLRVALRNALCTMVAKEVERFEHEVLTSDFEDVPDETAHLEVEEELMLEDFLGLLTEVERVVANGLMGTGEKIRQAGQNGSNRSANFLIDTQRALAASEGMSHMMFWRSLRKVRKQALLLLNQ